MKLTIRIVAVAAVLGLSPLASAGVAIIAHPSTGTSTLTVEQVSQIFMGRAKALPDGSLVTPVDLAEGAPARVQFVERVLGKNEQQLRSYWSRMIFTGKGQPPRSVATAAEVLRMVANTPGTVGYVDTKDLTTKVKVLYRVD